MVGLAARSPAVAVRESISAGPAADYSLALQTSLSDDASAQDRAVRSVVDRTFARSRVTVARTAYIASAPVVHANGAPARSVLALADDTDLRARATLTGGSWPDSAASAPAQVVVDGPTATALGLAVGDAFTIAGENGPVAVRVVGLWRPANAADPAWLGLASGSGGTDGRIAATDATIRRISSTPAVQWVVAPDPARTGPQQLTALHRGFTRIADDLTADPTASASPFAPLGRAAQSIVAMQQSIGALGAVVPVPLAVLAVCSVIALVLLAQLLMGARRAETRLLRARGATVGELVRAGAAESGTASLVAAVIGAVLAQVWLAVQVGTPTGPLEVVLPPLVVLAASLVVVCVVTAQSARSAIDAPVAMDAGRGRTVVSFGLAVLALVAAAVTLWRFLAYGSPIGAGGAVDPVGVVAPAAVLCAVAMLGLLVFGPAAAAVERLAGRDRGLTAVLPARQVGRGLGLFAAPVALIVLTVGAATFSAGYVGTWNAFLRDSSQLVNGADVRAELGVEGTTRGASDAIDAGRFAQLPGAGVSVPALGSTYNAGQTAMSFVAVDARSLPALVTVGDYMLDTAGLERSLVPGGDPLHGISVPPKADSVSVGTRLSTPTVDSVGTASENPQLAVTVWLADRHGELVPARGADIGEGTARVYTAAVPSGGPWTLVAVDATISAGDVAAPVAVSVVSLDARSGTTSVALAIPAGQHWAPTTKPFGSSLTLRPVDRSLLRVRRAPGPGYARHVRAVPPGRKHARTDRDHRGRRRPERFPRRRPGDARRRLVEPHGSHRRNRSGGPGRDRRAGRHRRPPDASTARCCARPRRHRASTRSGWRQTIVKPSRPRSRTRRARMPWSQPHPERSSRASWRVPSRASGWGARDARCSPSSRSAQPPPPSCERRRAEVVVLRAVGMSGREQARSRRAEVVGVVTASFVFGLAGGILIVLLAGNALARLSVVTAPSTLSVHGSVDALSLAAALGAVVIAVGAVVWAYGRGVRRQAGDTAYREEIR